jgi:YidC/Oxa1 family membrane protein insertase
LLVQAPVVGVVYALFILPVIAGHANALLGQTLVGVPLGSSLAGSIAAGTLTPAAFAVFVTIVLAIALVGEVTRRVLQPLQPQQTVTAAQTAQSAPPALRLLGVLQFVTAVVAVFVPLAAALYLLVTVAWTLAQRMLLRRVYPFPEPRTA